MNAPLKRALEALANAQALGVPAMQTVEHAAEGMLWSGVNVEGIGWSLMKRGGQSFDVNCGSA